MKDQIIKPKLTDREKKTLGRGAGLEQLGSSFQTYSLFPAAHWAYTEARQVHSYRAAIRTTNLRYFSGRAALGLFVGGAALRVVGNALIANATASQRLNNRGTLNRHQIEEHKETKPSSPSKP